MTQTNFRVVILSFLIGHLSLLSSAHAQTTINDGLTVNGGAVVNGGLTADSIAGTTFTGAVVHGSQSLTGSNFGITGGTINNTTIGSTTPSTGSFTTLGASGSATIAGTLGVGGVTTIGSGSQNIITLTPGAAAGVNPIIDYSGTASVRIKPDGTGTLSFGSLKGTTGNNLILSSGGNATSITFGDPGFGIGSQGTWTFSPNPSVPDGLTGSKLTVNNILQSAFFRTPGLTYTFGLTVPPPVLSMNANYTGDYTGEEPGPEVIPYRWTIASDNVDYRGVSGHFSLAHMSHNFGGTGTIGSRNTLRLQLTNTAAFNDTVSTQQHTVLESWFQASFNAGGTASTLSGAKGYAYSMNPQVLLKRGASNWMLANALGEVNLAVEASTQPVTVGGTVTSGDILTITFTSADITGSPVSVTYTPGTSQTLAMVANGLVAAVNSNTALRDAGVAASRKAATAQVDLYWPLAATVAVSTSTSGGATESLSLGTFIAGASAYAKDMGTFIRLSSDSADAEGVSSFLALGGQSLAPWSGQFRRGLQFGGGGLSWSWRRDGTLLGVDVQTSVNASGRSDPMAPNLIKYGIDFMRANFTKAAGAAYRSPGMTDRGSGVLELRNAVLTSSNNGFSIDVPGLVATSVSISNGGGGGSGVATGNYFVGDLVFDSAGGQHEVTSVSSATGAVTGISTLVYPSTTGSAPSNPLATVGGSGAGLTLNITWPSTKLLTLNPSGGAVTIQASTLTLSGIPTSCSGRPAGSVAAIASVLTVC